MVFHCFSMFCSRCPSFQSRLSPGPSSVRLRPHLLKVDAMGSPPGDVPAVQSAISFLSTRFFRWKQHEKQHLSDRENHDFSPWSSVKTMVKTIGNPLEIHWKTHEGPLLPVRNHHRKHETNTSYWLVETIYRCLPLCTINMYILEWLLSLLQTISYIISYCFQHIKLNHITLYHIIGDHFE